jgi:hypothetical protein
MRFLNKARLDKPARNQHNLKHGTHSNTTSSDSARPPLLKITLDIASAAALLAELGADVNVNLTEPVRMSASAFWMEGIARKGAMLWGNDPGYKASTARFPMYSFIPTYMAKQVFRNVVTDYNADLTGRRVSLDCHSCRKAIPRYQPYPI